MDNKLTSGLSQGNKVHMYVARVKKTLQFSVECHIECFHDIERSHFCRDCYVPDNSDGK